MRKCPECNSEKIIKDAITSNSDGGKLSLAVDEQPNNLIIKNRKYSELTAQICGDCGFVQFFVKFPETLWSAYKIQRNII